MPPVTRLGDNCTGHGCYPARPSVAGSPTVFANNLPVIRVTDPYDTHCCGPACHGGTLAEGSSTVFAEGLAVGRQGDPIDCGSVVDEHSPDVYVGG